MNKRRLLKLAEFLETVPRDRFDYSKWASSEWGGKKDLSCGTTACALGWATAMPMFQKIGLKLTRDEDGYVFVVDSSGREGFKAAEAAFDVTWQASAYLFDPYYSKLGLHASPKAVAAHIRAFVERGGMP